MVPKEILFRKRIFKSDLSYAHVMLCKFVSKLDSILKSGVHELLHLCDCTEQFGQLNICSCFQYEEHNRKIMSLIPGKDLIGDEFIKVFFNVLNLSAYTATLDRNKNELFDFIVRNAKVKSSNHKKLKIFNCVVFYMN